MSKVRGTIVHFVPGIFYGWQVVVSAFRGGGVDHGVIGGGKHGQDVVEEEIWKALIWMVSG